MRIAYTSDIHLHRSLLSATVVRNMAKDIANDCPDIVAICGDLADQDISNYRQCCEIFASIGKPVFVVPGNHDVWAKSGYSSMQLLETVLPKITKEAGCYWLPRHPAVINNVGFAGSIAWYDYSDSPNEINLQVHKWEISRDGEKVDWPWIDTDASSRFRQHLESDVKMLEKKGVKKIVCLTHVPLLYTQAINTLAFRGIQPEYYSNPPTGRMILKHPSVKLVLSGHIHAPTNIKISNTRFMTGQSDYGKPAYDIVEI